MRFEHIFANDEDQKYSQSVSFDVRKIFDQMGFIVSMNETTLAANQWLDQSKRLKFTASTSVDNGVSHTEFNENTCNDVSNLTIFLNPMEIRSFVINFSN